MSGAFRKKTSRKYVVRAHRTIEMTATVEIEARSVEEAEGIADVHLDECPYLFMAETTSARTKASVKR